MIRSGCPMVTRVDMSPVRMYVYHQLWVVSLSCIFSSVIGRMCLEYTVRLPFKECQSSAANKPKCFAILGS